MGEFNDDNETKEDEGSTNLIDQRALGEIQQRINEHLLEVSRLSVQLNSVVPINRLPLELLVYIFSFCTPSALDYQSSKEEAAWLRITHVCHHWREVALQATHLWTNITVGRGATHYTRACLVRSKSAPLHIYVHNAMEWTWTSEILEEISGELSRAEDLVLGIVPPSFRAALSTLPSLPRLRTLEVALYCPTKSVNRASEELPHLLADLITDLKLPSIRELRLLCCAGDWSTTVPFLPQSLTHLCVSYSVDPSGNYDFKRPTFSEVVHSIAHLSLLRHLDLDNVPFPDDVTPFAPLSTVSLPSLEIFDISGSTSTCIRFLQHLTLPASTFINLFFTRYHTNILDCNLPFLASTINLKLSSTTLGEPVALESSMSSLHFYVSAGRADDASRWILLDGRAYGQELQCLCPHLPMHLITILTMVSPFPHRLELWTELAAAARNVETLILVNIPWNRRRWLHALLRGRQKTPDNDDNGETPQEHARFGEPYFPHLKTLVFRNTMFGYHVDAVDDRQTKALSDDTFSESNGDGDYEYDSPVEDSDEDQYDVVDEDELLAEELAGERVGCTGDRITPDDNPITENDDDDSEGSQPDGVVTPALGDWYCIPFVRITLPKTLQARKAMGHEIERVVFEDCSDLYRPDVEMLRGLVAVEWNPEGFV
ncbi:hypothetical protein BXZ70DRAFT_1011100 [Cristinia sonorae]|uniref:F-box domain-containing protein n=1 Tax=Cristinia sonorae TaxID=1940300 RepID=A0A8K0XLR8_9AGAR|nr:hypothetical protein BXZ70DRAFT_1011100 [Cristinia sonorae]